MDDRPLAELVRESFRKIAESKAAMATGKSPPRKGEFMRHHKHLALLCGKNEVEELEKHYAAHGVHVTHRPTGKGDYEPVVTQHSDWQKMCASRGFPHVAG